MQLAWSKIWTRVTVSISYDDNHYTTGTSTLLIAFIVIIFIHAVAMETGRDIKAKLSIVVEGNPKSPFSKATTPRCRGGSYFFPWVAPLTSPLIDTL